MCKITVGVCTYNEIHMIRPCIESIIDFADELIITDGTSLIFSQKEEEADSLSKPSDDGTLDYLHQLERENNKVVLIKNGGMPIMAEKDVKTCQLGVADCDWFFIVDADEIWTKTRLALLRKLLETEDSISDVAIWNKVFMWDPFHYIEQSNWRVFRKRPDRSFYGANEVTNSTGQMTIEEPTFFHYGYIDPEKVKYKCNYYSGKKFRGCGNNWYENVYLKFDGTNAEDLIKNNGGTLHMWGKIDEGFAADQWGKLLDYDGKHPAVMKPYFDSRGWNNVEYFY